MRILLVAPDRHFARDPSAKKVSVPLWAKPVIKIAGLQYAGERRKAPFPPLGLITVASLTPAKHEVRVVDEAVEEIDFDSPADLVGITCNTATFSRACQIADIFRARGKTVVMGGIHPTALPEEALEHCDAVLAGEAEGVWPGLLADVEEKRLQPIYRTPDFPPLGGYPFPRRDLLKSGAYWANTVQTARGCPFGCEFCSVTAFFGGTYRTRPVAEVIAEVESLDRGPVFVVDDNIMAVPEHSGPLFEALKRLPRKIRWYGQASLTMMKHPELLVSAAKSGCRGLFIGLESISERILRKMGKPFNHPCDYRKHFAFLHSLGIRVIGAFVFGEDDDADSIDETVRFVDEAKIDLVQYALATPLPGTKLWERVRDRIVETDRSKYDGRHVTVQHPTLSKERLQEVFNSAYRRTCSYRSIFHRLFTLKGDWFTFLALNLAFRQGTDKWITRGD